MDAPRRNQAPDAPTTLRDRDRDDVARQTDGADEGAWDDDRLPTEDRLSARDVDGERPEGDGRDAERRLDDDGQPRRRRRGRRGGRGRSRGRRDAADAPVAGREAGPEGGARRPDELDDEPLPSGYGARPPARSPAGREPSRERSDERSGDGERSGSSRGRRRRRRGGEGRTASAGQSGESGRSRRSRRSRDERTGSSRVRRADFAPVAGGYDEDDEGLEFLGVEDADHAARRREARPSEDDVLAESGLDNVREVPSWVEAIGIVIAGNLDARSRGRGGEGGRHRDR